MKIQWNTVTWYSKCIALVLFVALLFLGFWLGINYGTTTALLSVGPAGSSQTSPTSTIASNEYYSNTAEWQTDSRMDAEFSIAYPIDFTVDDVYSTTPTENWRMDANGTSGLTLFTITIPKVFEPHTNFADAELTVGMSSNPAAVTDCLMPDPTDGPAASSSLNGATTTINGIVFSVFQSASAGAGNYYQTTSYRTVHSGACYAVEYTIHSSQIANYPPQYNLQTFDPTAVAAVLNKIVGTFNFL